MADLKDRMIRAAKLDPNLYEEVEADKSALPQAMLVVVISSLAAGIGAIGVVGIKSIIVLTILSLAAWFVWAYITYFVGTRFLPTPQTKADHGELLRTIGFSNSAGVLRIFYFIPYIGPLISFIAHIWTLVAMVIAVRQALDYTSTARAVGVCVIGWVIQFVFIYAISKIFGIPIVPGA
jgi:hypothetical protein